MPLPWGVLLHDCELVAGEIGGYHIWRPPKFRIFGPPIVMYRNQLILFLLSAFWGPPPTTHCGRHIWKPPYGFTPTLFSNTYGFPVSNTALAHRSMLITEVTPLESVTFISKSRFPSPFQFQPKLSRGHWRSERNLSSTECRNTILPRKRSSLSNLSAKIRCISGVNLVWAPRGHRNEPNASDCQDLQAGQNYRPVAPPQRDPEAAKLMNILWCP